MIIKSYFGTGKLKLEDSYDPGHLKNVQQAKIMPLTNDRRIVTACGDGQVKLLLIYMHFNLSSYIWFHLYPFLTGEVLEDGQVHTKTTFV